MNRYLVDLAANIVGAERKTETEKWKISSHKIDIDDYILVSAAAYICKKERDLETVESKVKCDIIFSYVFDESKSCTIKMSAYSEIGNKIADSLLKSDKIIETLTFVKI